MERKTEKKNRIRDRQTDREKGGGTDKQIKKSNSEATKGVIWIVGLILFLVCPLEIMQKKLQFLSIASFQRKSILVTRTGGPLGKARYQQILDKPKIT